MQLEHLIRKAYQAVPLNATQKMRLRDGLFSALPWAFKWSGAYKTFAYSADSVQVTKPRKGNDGVFGEVWREAFRLNAKANPAGTADYVEKSAEAVDAGALDIKALAFYLPQFHPIPENDKWWGKGFTEWTNVSKALPQFVGHYQPRLPSDLGFYDLRLPEVMHEQVALAKHYGVHGFCFYHYWFSGTRLLDRPVKQFMADKTLDLPFCLCWANENWSRRWDGKDSELLMEQKYLPDDALTFIQDLKEAFDDPRYIRVDGKPMLLVYRVNALPEIGKIVETWRSWAKGQGYPGLYLVAVRSFDITDPRPFGFDAAVEFPPHQIAAEEVAHKQVMVNPAFAGRIYDYNDMAGKYAGQTVEEYTSFKGVMPSWDNEARKPGGGMSFMGSTPEGFKAWVAKACEATLKLKAAERFVFINAWNEWAEGTYLEPDRRYGYAYLQALAQALGQFRKPR